MSTFYTCSVVTNRGTSIEPIHDLLTVTGSGGQASIPHRIVESSSIGYFDRIQHFILTKAEVEQLRANTNIWNISYQTPIHEWEFRGIGHVNRHTSLNPTFNPPATNQELLTASFTPATLTNPGGYNPVSIEHFISGGEHLLIEDTQTNRRLDIHRNFETGSYARAILEAAEVAMDYPDSEIRIVIYSKALKVYNLSENFWVRIDAFKGKWDVGFAKLAQVYWRGRGPYHERVKLYAAVPSLAKDHDLFKLLFLQSDGTWKQKT